MVDNIEEVVKKVAASRNTLRIYETLEAMKLASYSVRNLFAHKIAETIEAQSTLSTESMEMAYFLTSVMPYHSAQFMDMSTKTLSLSEL